MSPDKPGDLRKWKDKINLPYTLVADQEHKVLEAWGVWGEKQLYGKTYLGVLRSHWVIDEEGRIIDAQINVTPEQSVERALKTLIG